MGVQKKIRVSEHGVNVLLPGFYQLKLKQAP